MQAGLLTHANWLPLLFLPVTVLQRSVVQMEMTFTMLLSFQTKASIFPLTLVATTPVLILFGFRIPPVSPRWLRSVSAGCTSLFGRNSLDASLLWELPMYSICMVVHACHPKNNFLHFFEKNNKKNVSKIKLVLLSFRKQFRVANFF